MSNFDLLDSVQPTEGWYAIIGIGKDKVPHQKIVATRAEADRAIAAQVKLNRDVYFGVAKFGDPAHAPVNPKTGKPAPRGKNNVRSLKALWMDLDCGEGKPYASQDEAAVALKGFVEAMRLPVPIIVNSGRGLHIYWPLTEEVSRAQWEPVSEALRDAAVAHGLKVDPTCFEVARVLRVPGTMNHKGSTPLPVSVLLGKGNPLGVAEMATLLAVELPEIDAEPHESSGIKGLGTPSRRLSPLAQQIIDASDTDFLTIIKRGTDGCRQIVHCIENRKTLSEPLWRAALSVAAVCRDREQAYRAVSEDHPDFDIDKARDKAARTAGPHSCTQFDLHNPGGCKGCPHLGKLTSPVQLGRIVVEGPPIVEQDPETGEVIQYDLPRGYLRGKNGGVWKKDKNPEEPDKLVYPHDIYVIARIKGRGDDHTKVRVHMPKEGIEDIYIANGILGNSAELRKLLNNHSVIPTEAQFPLLKAYLHASINDWMYKDAHTMIRQFGWNSAHDSFNLGEIALTKQGRVRTHMSESMDSVMRNFGQAGTLEGWQEVMNLYGRPGMEPFAFAAASAFGSPLLHMSGLAGSFISLVSGASGTGKTTALKMSNSVWGHPTKMLAIADDTYLSKVHKMGIYNSIPLGFDEVTNTDPKQISDLLYNVTHGRGRDRMLQSANDLRKNDSTWNLIALSSSNQSIYEALSVIKSSPQGEIMRVMEYYLDFTTEIISPAEGERMFNHQLDANYGHAGPRYAETLVHRYAEAKIMYHRIAEELRRRAGMEQNERFWVGTAASNLTGVFIGNKTGLIKWDFDAMFDWTCHLIKGLRADTGMPADEDIRVLSELIFENAKHMLVINGGTTRRAGSLAEMPIHEPKNGIVKVRYERDNAEVYLHKAALVKACNERKINSKELLGKLRKRGICKPIEVQKRMTKGTLYDTPSVRALVFKADHPDFSIMDAVMDRARAETEVFGEMEA